MIILDGVSKSYDGSGFAVRELDLQIAEGELLVIVGASGSGKSTTLRLINRLLEPSSGRIFVDGEDTALLDPVSLRRGIGYVIQDVGLFPHLTVAENVAVLPSLMNWERRRTEKRVLELLELVRLPFEEFGSRMPDQLSGGQRQRVGFARALAVSPRIMLMDEPFGSLDPLTREGLREDFLSLRVSLGFTTVLVTHDMTEALLISDRIAVMDEGRIVAIGKPGSLLANPGHASAESMLESPRRNAEMLEKLKSEGGRDGPVES